MFIAHLAIIFSKHIVTAEWSLKRHADLPNLLGVPSVRDFFVKTEWVVDRHRTLDAVSVFDMHSRAATTLQLIGATVHADPVAGPGTYSAIHILRCASHGWVSLLVHFCDTVKKVLRVLHVTTLLLFEDISRYCT